MLIDCATNEPDTGNNKVVWIIIIVFAHIIGAILYWMVRRDQRIAEVGH
jgi:Mg2+ and Co2+ transporter CorA